MSDLADFQDAFAAALRGAGLPSRYGAPDRLAAGLAVYRNTATGGAIAAIADNYPTVRRLVGDAWFADAAHAYLSSAWPDAPSLAAFGADFPDLLAALPSAADLPYLSDVARIDRLWTEAHLAADACSLAADALATAEPEALADTRLSFAPSTRLAWFETPAASIWLAHRAEPEPDLSTMAWRAEGLLLTRPRGAVEALRLGPADYAFAAALARGDTLGSAALAALEADPVADVGGLIAALLNHGAFADRITP